MRMAREWQLQLQSYTELDSQAWHLSRERSLDLHLSIRECAWGCHCSGLCQNVGSFSLILSLF